jgi:hypothetical protein
VAGKGISACSIIRCSKWHPLHTSPLINTF